jgi:phosphoglycolate phosphatase-like HAD superfamily hydrolase
MTLADTDHAFYLALEKTLAERGLEPSSLNEYKEAGGAKQTLEKRYGRELNEEVYSHLKSNYVPLNVKLFPKTKEVLLRLKKLGVLVFVIQ